MVYTWAMYTNLLGSSAYIYYKRSIIGAYRETDSLKMLSQTLHDQGEKKIKDR